MAFGFSVGDFIAVGELIANIVGCLQSANGSTAQYQGLMDELHSLNKSLLEVDKLRGTAEQMPSIHAIKSTALMCKHQLTVFYSKIEKYANHLQRGGSGKLFEDAAKKIQWRFSQSDEIDRLRAYLNAHVGSINMLLLTQSLNSSRLAATRSEDGQAALAQKLEDCHASVLCVRTEGQSQQVYLQGNRTMLQKLSKLVNGDLVPQIKALVGMATKIWEMNLEIYNIVVKWQTTTPYPDLRHTWFQDPVRLEDALGRIIPVPSEYNWGKVEAIINDQFSTGPGRRSVLNDEWELFNANNSRQIVSDAEWRQLIPGMKLTMAIIVPEKYLRTECCPRPYCPSTSFMVAPAGGNICCECKVWFEKASTRKKRKAIENDENDENEMDDNDQPNSKRRRRREAKDKEGDNVEHSAQHSSTTEAMEDFMNELGCFKNIRVASQTPSKLMRPSQVALLPHLTDEQKTTYHRQIYDFHVIMDREPVFSERHKIAKANLLEATKELEEGMKRWVDRLTRAEAHHYIEEARIRSQQKNVPRYHPRGGSLHTTYTGMRSTNTGLYKATRQHSTIKETARFSHAKRPRRKLPPRPSHSVRTSPRHQRCEEP